MLYCNKDLMVFIRPLNCGKMNKRIWINATELFISKESTEMNNFLNHYFSHILDSRLLGSKDCFKKKSEPEKRNRKLNCEI